MAGDPSVATVVLPNPGPPGSTPGSVTVTATIGYRQGSYRILTYDGHSWRRSAARKTGFRSSADDTAAVLGEWLGMTPDEIDRLTDSGTVA